MLKFIIHHKRNKMTDKKQQMFEQNEKILSESPCLKINDKIAKVQKTSKGSPYIAWTVEGATWDDVICPHASKEDKKCNLASEVAGQDIHISPKNCATCYWKNLERGINVVPTNGSPGVEFVINEILLEQNKSDAYKVFRDMLGPGPGTELHKIIPKFLESESCSCRDMAKKMNFWGPEKCEMNREYLVDYLVKKGKDVKLFGWVPKKMMREVANRMLTMAIERAKENETEEWFVAVTTAPRKTPTVNQCLESLTLAGFRPYIFAEPETQIDDTYKDRLILNQERYGVWHNFISSAKYAIENSNAEIIMTVQDDTLFHPDSKSFTESILWPAKDVGFVSLYTPKHYSISADKHEDMRPEGVNRVRPQSFWGNLALVWPRKVLEELLSMPMVDTWVGLRSKGNSWPQIKQKRMDHPHLIQNSDTAIGRLINKMQRSMYFLDPSPVNHFAKTSTTGHGGNQGRRNCGRCAKFSMPLESQIPLKNNGEKLMKFTYKEIVI